MIIQYDAIGHRYMFIQYDAIGESDINFFVVCVLISGQRVTHFYIFKLAQISAPRTCA